MSDADPTKPDLSLVDTDWMIDELIRRCDAIVIARELDRDDRESQTLIDSAGTLSARLGLAVRLEQRLLRLADATDSPPDDDDD